MRSINHTLRAVPVGLAFSARRGLLEGRGRRRCLEPEAPVPPSSRPARAPAAQPAARARCGWRGQRGGRPSPSITLAPTDVATVAADDDRGRRRRSPAISGRSRRSTSARASRATSPASTCAKVSRCSAGQLLARFEVEHAGERSRAQRRGGSRRGECRSRQRAVDARAERAAVQGGRDRRARSASRRSRRSSRRGLASPPPTRACARRQRGARHARRSRRRAA